MTSLKGTATEDKKQEELNMQEHPPTVDQVEEAMKKDDLRQDYSAVNIDSGSPE